MEADEVTGKLELCDRENKALKEEMAKEIENVSMGHKNQGLAVLSSASSFRRFLPVEGVIHSNPVR